MHLIAGRKYKIIDMGKESLFYSCKDDFKDRIVVLFDGFKKQDSGFVSCLVCFEEKFDLTFRGSDDSETIIHIDPFTGDIDDAIWYFDSVKLEEIWEN